MRGTLSCACVYLCVPFEQVPRKSLAGFQGGQAYVGKDGKSYGLLVPYRHSFSPLGGANSKLTADGFNALDVMREVCTRVRRRSNLHLLTFASYLCIDIDCTVCLNFFRGCLRFAKCVTAKCVSLFCYCFCTRGVIVVMLLQ